MILGTGVDLVDIERFTTMWQRHGKAMARRILSVEEQSLLEIYSSNIATRPVLDKNGQNTCMGTFFAKHFATKEALGKALGTGVTAPAGFQASSLCHADSGQPLVHFSPQLEKYLHKLALEVGFRKVVGHVSLSDEAGLVVAQVILEYV